jgi:hypothetical protein
MEKIVHDARVSAGATKNQACSNWEPSHPFLLNPTACDGSGLEALTKPTSWLDVPEFLDATDDRPAYPVVHVQKAT